jgi:hypothetical protein
MMRTKTYREQLFVELSKTNPLVCYYCGSVKGNSLSCCGEVHFVKFRDLEAGGQQDAVQHQVQEWEDWSARQ